MRLPTSIAVGVLMGLGATPARGEPSHDLASYALLAVEQLSARSRSVLRGDIGVNAADGTMAVRGLLLAPQSQVVAKTTSLVAGTTCAALFSDGIVGASCGTKMSFAPPIANGLSGIRAASTFPTEFRGCTGPDVLVAPGETRSIMPGTYGDVTIRSRSPLAPGILRLEAGTYEFCNVRTGRNAQLRLF